MQNSLYLILSPSKDATRFMQPDAAHGALQSDHASFDRLRMR